MEERFAQFELDTPELIGGLATWLAVWEDEDRNFISGRYVSTNWDVEELVKRKDEIVEKGLLDMGSSTSSTFIFTSLYSHTIKTLEVDILRQHLPWSFHDSRICPLRRC